MSSFDSTRGPELTAALMDITTQIRVLQAQALSIVAEMDSLNIAGAAGHPSLTSFLSEALRITRRKASRMVTFAEATTPVLTPTGHLTPPTLPATREALLEGALDEEHVEVIVKTIHDIPDHVSTAQRELAESTLATHARSMDPNSLRKAAHHLLALMDHDGREPDDPGLAEPANKFRYAMLPNGWMKFNGQIEPETAEQLRSMFDDIAKPVPEAPGVPDPRDLEHRQGDGICDVIWLAARSTGSRRGRAGSQLPNLNVTLDLNVLMEGLGAATLDGGAFLCPEAARRLACDAHIIPIAMRGKSIPVDVGRKYRTITPRMRAKLIARDHGCAHPTCDRPPRWTDGHHIHHWADGGPTNLDNLVLLCRRHHRILHHSDWRVQIVAGLPEFTPPKHVDPEQKPIRNTLRHTA